MRALAWMVMVTAACGGSPPPSVGTPSVGVVTGVSSSCNREGLQPVAPGMRRLELSLEARPGAIEVVVDGTPRVSAATGTGCAYLEIEAGAPHEVAVRARGEQGIGANFRVATENPKQPWWYDVFSFQCGEPTCEKEQLAAWGHRAQSERRQMTDPCSAMQVRNVKWASERAPRLDLVTGLDLTFTVFVYKDAFDQEPRDRTCPEN